MKERKRIRAGTAVGLLLYGMALLLWLVCMYCLTSVTAEYAAQRYIKAGDDRAETIMAGHIAPRYDRTDVTYANFQENALWEAVSIGEYFLSTLSIEGNSGFLLRQYGGESFSATAVYDGQGNCLVGSWEDFFYFEYLTEEQWADRAERSYNNARACFDREKLTEEGRAMAERGAHSAVVSAMRFTGSFDGTEFLPTRIEFIAENIFDEALRKRGNGRFTVSGVAQDFNLPWTTAYEDPDALPEGTETVTLYSDYFHVCYQEDSPPFSYQGKDYANVATLLQKIGPSLKSGRENLSRYEKRNLILVSQCYRQTYEGETHYSPYYAGRNGYDGQPPTMDLYVVSAVYCSPWRTAMRELRLWYLGTFAFAMLLVQCVLSLIRRQLIRPVQLVNDALEQERPYLEQQWWTEELNWRETHILEQRFEEAMDRQRMRKNEITRLETALDYARDAEQSRRRMVSGIAHELKTPLAVIHSYTEGLKERIAEDKRDKYLDVILSESERMDGMVLEMLDLSRLEAGKVKLSRDTFSLRDLTKSVFEKLERAAEAKDLHVRLDLMADAVMEGDEGRIRQVVENFATNAIKYTPVGGNISVRIGARGYRTTLVVENECPPLSDEALSKVWDTFYRADEARPAGGTGLGLAIAKSIVELHGGTCSAYRTHTGVAFSFTI